LFGFQADADVAIVNAIVVAQNTPKKLGNYPPL
jgi:hypothetical protein